MFVTLKSMASLLTSVALLMLGSGLFNSFIALRASIEGFDPETIGLLGSAFYAGLLLGTLRCGPLINRVGHIRAFGAFAAITAAAILAFPFIVSALSWMALRALIGFNIAGLYMVCESWLNTKASSENRGTILSLYMVTVFLAMGTGQILLSVGDPESDQLFMLGAGLMALSLVPVAITSASHPAPVSASHFGFRKLYRISPVAVVGCVTAGLAVGSLFSMSPIFAKELGMNVQQIGVFMGILMASGLLLQLPVGWWSDRTDRRQVMLAMSGLVGATALAIVALMRWSYSLDTPSGTIEITWASDAAIMFMLAGLLGGALATVYPLCIAYANDYVDASDLVQASAGLVLAYSIGAVMGPTVSALVMGLVGPAGLFWFVGLTALAFALFLLHRMRQRAAVPASETESFVPLPDATATPVATEVDPRSALAPQPPKGPRWAWILDRRRGRRVRT